MASASVFTRVGLFPSLSGELFFLILLPVIAVVTALVVYFSPQYFELVFLLDLWLLGYHHVIATFSRLAMDSESFKQHWWLVFVLPILVVMAVFSLSNYFGVAGVATIYLYWQWFHYTRQSEGVLKAYARKSASLRAFTSVDRVCFYALPVAAFIWMLSRGETHFLYMPLWVLPVAKNVALCLLVISALLAVLWFLRRLGELRNGTGSVNVLLYGVGHYFIYSIAYVIIDQINIGWLCINIWHNAQYIIFVWVFNRNRFGGGVRSGALVISYLSQPGRSFMYFGFFIIATYFIYSFVEVGIENGFKGDLFEAAVIVYASINFHHYVVDSLIWKLRRPSVSRHI